MATIKSIGAVLGGLILTFILSRGMDVLLESVGIFPTVEYQQQHGFNVVWMNLLALFYRAVFTMAGGYATAKFAPNKPMKHVIILGIVGTTIAVAANIVVSMIPEMANVLPIWFSIALVVTVFPSVWGGGKFAMRNIKHPDSNH